MIQMFMQLFVLFKDIDKYNSSSVLPRDVAQHIFNDLVSSQLLTNYRVEGFQDCALQFPLKLYLIETFLIYLFLTVLFFLQDLSLGEYPGFNDSWVHFVSLQGPSLLTVDLSGSGVTEYGLIYIK